MTERPLISLASVEHIPEETNHQCDKVENMRMLPSVGALIATASNDVTNAADESFLPLPLLQHLQCSPDTFSSTNNHDRKRLRDIAGVAVVDGGHDYDYATTVKSGKDQDVSATSTTSSSSSSHQENYQQNGSMDESDYSSDQEHDGNAAIGPEATSKTKRARTGSLAGPARSAENDSTRRTQSPACRYDLVRIALLRFRELFGNACVKRGFVVPDNSPDWPIETWGIRLDLVTSFYFLRFFLH